MSNDKPLTAVQLVENVWASHVKVVGTKRFAQLAQNPKESINKYQAESAGDRGLRFNLVEALQLLAAALELANKGLEIYKTYSARETHIKPEALDAAVRGAVGKDPQIAPLLDTEEYQRLLAMLASKK